jgi:hypothetical protein
MKAGELFSKTMPFAWAKMFLGLLTVLVSALLFGILMGLAWLFNSDGVTGIMILIWLGAVGTVRFLIMHYVGYLVKAGHIAVMAEAVTTGRIPGNQVDYGKRMVAERFATSNIYFAVDRLVSGAVKQIQRGIGKLGSALDFMPGMKQVAGLAQFFIELSLGYIDECCLGYTFYKKDQGAFKSAADGVVIYAQNWKSLLGSAAKTMAMVILGMAGITLGLFLFLGILFRVFAWPGWVAFAIALLFALAIKFAFIDSFILARTMAAYMGVAPTTVITLDLYGKLCSLSSKFKELFNNGQNEQPAQQPAYAATAGSAPSVQAVSQAPQKDKPIFCGQCGAQNNRGTKFCGGCGAPISPK